MAYEMLVGLQVSDDAIYAAYREAMTPILKRYGGGFRFDFVVGKVLRSEASHEINRVFTIYFKDLGSKNGFFSDPEYKTVKEKFFERSVKNTTIISQYER